MYCTQCGNNNEPDAKFCVSCGAKLTPTSTPLSSPPAPPGQMPDEDFQFHAAPKRGNGPGVASFILSLINVVIWIIGIYFSYSLTMSGFTEEDPEVAALGMVMLVAFITTIVGMILGIVGCALSNRRKAMAITGLIINVLLLLLVIVLIILGATSG